MTTRIYKKLAKHLDQLPGGFAPSETGAELRLLQRLFTPDEAALALHLTLEREEAEVIAQRAGLPSGEVAQRLEQMAAKGLLWSTQSSEGGMRYQAVPFVVGIYEFQVGRLDLALLDDINAFWSTQAPRPEAKTIPQMRTIPVGESIAYQSEVLPYDAVGALLAEQERFAVVPCICRQVAHLRGAGCDAPIESCLSFGDMADYTIRTGHGRAITREEALQILAQADAANLVLQPSNSRHIEFLCTCCGCCCGVLHDLQRQPKPSEAVANDYIATFEATLCHNCGICLERCQMAAFRAGPEHVLFDAGRCIGCGLCATTCPSGALTLTRKAGRAPVEPPATFQETWRIIAQEQAAQRRQEGN